MTVDMSVLMTPACAVTVAFSVLVTAACVAIVEFCELIVAACIFAVELSVLIVVVCAFTVELSALAMAARRSMLPKMSTPLARMLRFVPELRIRSAFSFIATTPSTEAPCPSAGAAATTSMIDMTANNPRREAIRRSRSLCHHK